MRMHADYTEASLKKGFIIIIVYFSKTLRLKKKKFAILNSHEYAGCQNKNLKFTLFAGTARKRLKI
jgi:hypothetical protein